jgi:hypothetical protein
MYGVAVVAVGSIFRLHYEAILKENARVMKKTNSDREEKNDNDEREPFFFFYCVRRFNPLVLARAIFCILFFFYTHRNPFSCAWGRGKRKKNQYRRNPIVSSGEEPVWLQQQSLYSFLFFIFFFFILFI